MEFFTGNYIASMLEQNLENLEGLNLKPDAHAVFAQLSGTRVETEVAEADLALQ